MNGRNEENLRPLFEKFGNSKQAEEAAEDIRKGERILREQPAPEPDGQLIADIKTEIAARLPRRKVNAFRKMAYKAAVVAAAVIILAAVSVRLFEKGGEPEKLTTASKITEGIWESSDVAADDAELATLIAETEQIERDLLAIQLGENGDNGGRAVAELEMELIEINSNFWKG